jgi:predicted GIY-YIG superfamily endonuclease
VFYVYLIESLSAHGRRYVGLTTNLKQRLLEHNAGKSAHTSKYLPWRLVTYIAFSDRSKAESYSNAISNRAPVTPSPPSACGSAAT